jgi:hypothetical protein
MRICKRNIFRPNAVVMYSSSDLIGHSGYDQAGAVALALLRVPPRCLSESSIYPRQRNRGERVCIGFFAVTILARVISCQILLAEAARLRYCSDSERGPYDHRLDVPT